MNNFTFYSPTYFAFGKLAHTACYGNGRQGHIGGFVCLQQQDVEQIYRLALQDPLLTESI